MSDRLVFERSHLSDSVEGCRKFIGEFEEVCEKVRGEALKSERTFEGATGDKFREVTRSWLADAAEFVEIIRKLEKWVDAVGEGYDQAKSVNRRMFSD